jgi:RimJ/RimL family protein N-acetyltransferase
MLGRILDQALTERVAIVSIPALETRRLYLLPLGLADVPAVQAQFPRWEIVRYLSRAVPWPYPPDGALCFIRDEALPEMSAGTGWYWSIRRREMPDHLIGIINLTLTPDNNRGFWLSPDWWGQGLASEAAAAVTTYWFETLGQPVLRVRKASANVASQRISARSGMRVIASGERDYVGGRQLADLWEITRDAWRAAASDTAGSVLSD